MKITFEKIFVARQEMKTISGKRLKLQGYKFIFPMKNHYVSHEIQITSKKILVARGKCRQFL